MSSQSSQSSAREYDLVLFGATGFTGSLVAEYLARKASSESFRWAIAGRNRARLHEVKDFLMTLHPDSDEVGIIEADTRDWASLVVMANKARVLITTVGPYIDSGLNVVRACLSAATDYVDITGEPEFVAQVIEQFGQQARERAVRVVNCCGFDSIPADLGVLYTVLNLPDDQPVSIDGFIEFAGSMSGGTWRSAVTAMGRLREAQKQRAAKRKAHSSQGAPRRSGRSVRTVRPGFRYDRGLGGWVTPLPTIDPQVVRRSARALDRYGPDFRYAHHGLEKSFESLAVRAVSIGLMMALAQFGPTRRKLLSMRPSGAGPSAEERATSWFKATFIGTAGPKRVVTCVSGGDPGYSETAKMVSESALSLAFDSLPERVGVLTTAEAMGEALIERLHQAGIRFDVLEQA